MSSDVEDIEDVDEDFADGKVKNLLHSPIKNLSYEIDRDEITVSTQQSDKWSLNERLESDSCIKSLDETIDSSGSDMTISIELEQSILDAECTFLFHPVYDTMQQRYD